MWFSTWPDQMKNQVLALDLRHEYKASPNVKWSNNIYARFATNCVYNGDVGVYGTGSDGYLYNVNSDESLGSQIFD
ncbi:MAG: hypothetical protein QM734_13555 [Cyclobacteriaceae bacterium]